MPKRPNPFGDSSPLQFKSHIGIKEVDMGINKEQNMQSVYDKTRSLLVEGSRKSSQFSPKKLHPYKVLEAVHPTEPSVGQMRLDPSGQLCAISKETLPVSNGVIHQVSPRQDEAMEMETPGGANRAAISPANDNTPNMTGFSLARGQLQIDPCGHLCSASKGAGRQSSPGSMLGFRICQSCNRPSNVGARPCNFCDKTTCSNCLQQCHNCQGLFCKVCSILNYEDCFERSFCLQCGS